MIDLQHLLVRTSRTFALAVPLLPAPLAHDVALAYLIFRVADTLEDAPLWPRAKRIVALSKFGALLRSPSPDGAERLSTAWLASPPTEHDGYLALLRKLPLVLEALGARPAARRNVITRHALQAIEGMARFVAAADEDGSLRLPNLTALRRYCYTVAGIVGEMLTELMLVDTPALVAAAPALRDRAALFGEGLQLVNILEDTDDDARDGRVYIPADAPRSHVLGLARDGLRAAATYVTTLQAYGAPLGYVRFTALPVLLARATLDRVEELGAGAKLRRDEVAAWMAQLESDLANGAPALAAE